MITETKFVSIMIDYMEKRKARDNWMEYVDKAFSGAWEEVFKHDFEEFAIEILAKALDDTEWLDYFIYEKECQWFWVNINSKRYDINSFEKLYRLIRKDYDNLEY